MSGHLINLLIVHPMDHLRQELIQMLEGAEGIGSVAGHGDIASLPDGHADIVMVRPSLPLAENGDALRDWSLRNGSSGLAALLLAADAETIPTLHQAGFSAFVRTDAGLSEFQASFRAMLHDGVYLSGILADAVFAIDRDSRPLTLPVGLTAREQEVLRLIAVNMSNKDIARRLQLSVRTVETHRFHIRKKTKAGNWRELAVVAERLGLLAGYDLYSGLAERPAATGFHED